MRRRDFVKASAVALAVATVIPVMAAEKPWQEMTPEEFACATLDKRRAGVALNYIETHRCPKCGVAYLCPDRYVMPSCGPGAEVKRMSKGADSGEFMSCSPCSMNVERCGPAGYRELWMDAHGITEAKAA